jgi:hypothetical protein
MRRGFSELDEPEQMSERPLRQSVVEHGISAWVRCAAGLRAQVGNGSVLVASLVLLYGIATLGQQEAIPHGFWDEGGTGAAVLVALGLLAGVGSFAVTFSVKGLLRRAETDGKLITPCRELAWLVQSVAKVPHGTVGVHVWEIAGPPFARRLRRRTTFRSKGGRQTPVLWTRGKGVLGQCWADPEARDQLNDLEDLYARAPNEKAFYGLSSVDRFNMTWQELSAGRQYKLIWVAKLYAGLDASPKHAGMISVDVESAGYADELEKLLDERGDDIRALLSLCEDLLWKR